MASPQAGKQELDVLSGFYFSPLDKEIITLLKQKILHQQLPVDVLIPKVDVLSLDPDQIPFYEADYRMFGEWFFFSNRPSGKLCTRDGYWHPVTIPTEIKLDNKIVGFKRLLTFHWGINNGVESNYEINEYSLHPDALQPIQLVHNIKEKVKHFVLCRLRNMDVFSEEEEDLHTISYYSDEDEEKEDYSTEMGLLDEEGEEEGRKF